MNERIRQLAEQAGFSNDVHGVWPTITHTGEPILNKFAELIVKECMTNLYLNGYDDAMIQIKQHFGVEY
tara:strand:- start:1397 stop:1603 length:207 start_codon:yes stop_codon:yes gene_type:complete